VGIESALTSGDSVSIRDGDTQDILTSSDIAVTGAFTAQVESSLPDTIGLTVTSQQATLGTASVDLCDGGVNVYEFGDTISQLWAEESLSATRAGNLVELNVAAGLLPRGLKVVVGNLDNDHGSLTSVAQDGSIDMTVAAESGQDLAIFAVEGSCNGGGEPLIIEAP